MVKAVLARRPCRHRAAGFVYRSGQQFKLAGAVVKPWFGSINGQSTPASSVVSQAQGLHLTAVRLTNWINQSGTVGVDDVAESRWALVDANIAALGAAGLKVVLDLAGYRNLLLNAVNKPANAYTYDWSAFLTFVANRVNTVSGVKYKNDPAILYVSFAGEVNGPNYGNANCTTAELTAFYRTVTDFWRGLGSPHVLSPGGWLFMNDLNSGIDVAAIAALPNVDTVAMHAYSAGDVSAGIPNLAGFAAAAGKPWMNEEFGQDIAGTTQAARAAYFTDRFTAGSAHAVAAEGFWNIGDGTNGFSVGGYDISVGTATADAVIAHGPP